MYLYRGFSFTVCLCWGLLFYLFFFKSVKICLCSPLSGNNVFRPIGLSLFRRVLDSFTNFPIRTLIRAKIFQKFECVASSLSLLMNAFGNRFCKFLEMNDPLNF